ncbi:MAG: hypothetical protein HRT89_10645, partial [Lentisphaeria bacterium]|nr:M55 family metallopeptidase [Lentisphaeria bacterium]NQZ68514.1 hypothetical protein [Lentisphaeria bacterium]
VSGEAALEPEVNDLSPGAFFTAVKWGLLNDGEHQNSLDTDQYRAAKLSARHLSPLKARKLINATALEASKKLSSDPQSFTYISEITAPYNRVIDFRKNDFTPAYTARDSNESSFIDLMNQVIPKADNE